MSDYLFFGDNIGYIKDKDHVGVVNSWSKKIILKQTGIYKQLFYFKEV